MGYLSGSSPHIKSGAVSALSLVIYNDSKICTLLPDLLPSILELMHSKAIEVIKVSFFILMLKRNCVSCTCSNFNPSTYGWVNLGYASSLTGHRENKMLSGDESNCLNASQSVIKMHEFQNQFMQSFL